MYFDVVKINGRLHIVDGHTKSIYSPPDFIYEQLNNREKLKELANEFNQLSGRDIDAIMRFESSFNVKN